MSILNQQFFQMSNAIFCYGLKPIQLAVYSYLRCCAGKKETCFPRRGFIYTQPCYRSRNGLIQQTSNTYYILDLPELPKSKEEDTIIRGEIRGSGAEKPKAG